MRIPDSPICPLKTLLRALPEGGFALPLPGRMEIRLRGADAKRYLDGQLTNSMSRATPDGLLPACLLTVKGKLIAVPFVRTDFSTGEWILEVESETAERTITRLERYIVADDVEILPPVPAATRFHTIGIEDAPPGALHATRFHKPGLDVVDLPPGIELLDESTTRALRIAAGVPAPDIDWTTDHFPSEAGLDETAVDFHKGCYVGQEVVSRLESVGEARRKLVRWVLASPPPAPAIGAEVREPNASATEHPLGTITSNASFNGLDFGLAMLRKEAALPGARLRAAERAEIEIR